MPTPGPYGDIPDRTVTDDVMPYQERIEYIVDHRAPKKTTRTIAAPGAMSATYTQAEVEALRTAINEIRAALTDSGITS